MNKLAPIFFAGIMLVSACTADVFAAKSETHSLSPVTVTATKTEVDKESVPFSAVSVDRETIDSQPRFYMDNVGELVRDLPGVHVGQYYPWGPPWIHLRGTGYFIGRTVYLVDGLPIAPFMASTVSTRDVEQVDVLLGPSSALYGANASGGVVNFITRDGQEGMGANAELSYGSNNTIRPHASVGNKKDNLQYYLSYSGDYSDGYKMKPVNDALTLYNLGKKQYLLEASMEDNDYKTTYLTGKVKWKNDNGTGAWWSMNYAQRYLYGGQTNLVLDDNGDQVISTFGFDTRLGDIGKIKLSGAYQYYEHPQQYIKGLSLVNNQLSFDSSIVRNYDWTINRVPLEVQTDFYLSDNNVLTLGAFWCREEEERSNFYTATQKTSLSEWSTDQHALYLQDQMFFLDEKLSVVAGVRYDHWKYFDIYDEGSTNKTPDDVKKDHTTYRGGAKYKINENFAVRSSIGTAYWPGTALWFFQNISTGKSQREANPNLQPEKTWMADIGLDTSFPEIGVSFNITGYYGQIEDMVSYRYDETPLVEGGSIIRSQNLGGADIYGIEFELQKQFNKNFIFFTALTLNHSEVVDDPVNDGHQLRNAPDYWGSVGLRYLNPEAVNGELLFRCSDDRYYDDENTELPFFHMKSYETVDAKIWRDFRIDKRWILTTALSAVNILDEDYETEIVYVNPGRYLEGTVGVRYLF